MAYVIEFGLAPGEDFYVEFLFADLTTGRLMQPAPADHQFRLGQGRYSQIAASNLTGGVVSAPSGAVIVSISADRLGSLWLGGDGIDYALDYGCGPGYGRRGGHSIPFELRSGCLNPTGVANPAATTLIATGTISIGRTLMPSPRIQLGVYPTYLVPAADADPTVSQYLRALSVFRAGAAATLTAAVSADPDDPDRVVLENSRAVPVGGAYETLVATTFGFSTTTLAAIRTLALLQTP